MSDEIKKIRKRKSLLTYHSTKCESFFLLSHFIFKSQSNHARPAFSTFGHVGSDHGLVKDFKLHLSAFVTFPKRLQSYSSIAR